MTTLREAALLPCPFCGSKEITLVYAGQSAALYAVACFSCRAEGPVVEVEINACASWNNRAALQAQPQQELPRDILSEWIINQLLTEPQLDVVPPGYSRSLRFLGK
jgi:Lar family restriction alleviation protein